MRKNPYSILLLAALLAVGCAPANDADPAEADRVVTVSLLSTADAVVPGRPLELVWRFELADDWHLYWNGHNDSGFAPVIDLALPEGWSADPPLWPVPIRHLSPGGILDHIYEHELVLRQTVHPPAGLVPGGSARIAADLTWLVCLETCVPGDTLLTLDLAVAETANATPARALADAVKLPAPLPDDLLTARRDGDVVRLEVPGAAGLEFYPDTHCTGLVDPLQDAAGTGDVLRLRLSDAVGTLCGLLKVTYDDQTLEAYEITLDRFGHPTRHPGGTP